MATTTTTRRKVDFDSDELAKTVCEVPCRDDFGADELAFLFFSKSEYRTCRSTARTASQEAERSGASNPLHAAFGEKSKETQEQLNIWTTADHGCRGLERWSNRKHGEKRQLEQFSAIMMVLQAQHEMLTEHKAVDQEALRKIANKATREARHFARMMGKADSHAVAVELKLQNTSDNNNNSERSTRQNPPLWEVPGLGSGRKSSDEDEVSVPESASGSSVADSLISSVTKVSVSASLLSESDVDGDDEDADDVDFLPEVDEVQDDPATADKPKKSRTTKRLRLMKKLKRRLAAASSSTSSSTASRRSSTSNGSRRSSTGSSTTASSSSGGSRRQSTGSSNTSSSASAAGGSRRASFGSSDPSRTVRKAEMKPRRTSTGSPDADVARPQVGLVQ